MRDIDSYEPLVRTVCDCAFVRIEILRAMMFIYRIAWDPMESIVNQSPSQIQLQLFCCAASLWWVHSWIGTQKEKGVTMGIVMVSYMWLVC